MVQIHLLCVALFGLLAGIAKGDKKRLGDIFQVHESCLEDVANPLTRDNRPLADPTAPPGSRDNLLNRFYDYAYDIFTFAESFVDTTEYNDNVDTRKLLRSFFGIQPNPDQNDDPEPLDDTLDFEKLEEVRVRLGSMSERVSIAEADGPGKLKIACDFSYWRFQKATDKAFDKYGNPMMKDDGKLYTLREWEASRGRNFDDHWYFWADDFDNSASPERAYTLFQKSEWPSQNPDNPDLPFPVNPSTGLPDYCQVPNNFGLTIGPNRLSPYLKSEHIILCPRIFEVGDRYDMALTIDVRPQALGWPLATLGFAALTLLHELGHVEYPDTSHDVEAYLAKKKPDGKKVDEWPFEKSAFITPAEDSSIGAAFGPMDCMTLPLYDLANPVTTDMNDMVSFQSPECYAWFAWTLYLQDRTGQDWSSGIARVRGGPSIDPGDNDHIPKRSSNSTRADFDSMVHSAGSGFLQRTA